MADSTPSVLAEIIAGDALGLSAAARSLPAHRGDGPAAPSTIWRWILRGNRTIDGRVVKLEAARLGSRWLTSKAAITRFMEALTPPVTSDTAPSATTPTAAQERSLHNASVRKLERRLGTNKRNDSTH